MHTNMGFLMYKGTYLKMELRLRQQEPREESTECG
jgi:hypothetical protein